MARCARLLFPCQIASWNRIFAGFLTWTAPFGGSPPASSVSHGMVRSFFQKAIPVALLIYSSNETHQWHPV
jgi:hypothetical protein